MTKKELQDHLSEMMEGGVSLEELLDVMREYAEDQAEGLEEDLRAGDVGIRRSDITAWLKFGENLDAASELASELEA
jgi:hypothetical protein